MNIRVTWILRHVCVFTIIVQSATLLRGQVLFDPRGEDAATSNPTVADDVGDATSERAAADRTTGDTAITSGDVGRPAPTGRRSLPPPRRPDDQVSVERTPPPRPEAAPPAEPRNEPAAERPGGTARPYLGITFDPTVRDSAVVGAIVPESPAEQAGLQAGDVVEAINGQRIGSIEDAFAVVARLRPGETIDVEFSRRISARTQAMLESAPDDGVADTEAGTLPERRTTSYREPPRTTDEEPIPLERDDSQDRIRVLRRYDDNETRSAPNDDRGRIDRRQFEEWLRDRPREPQRPLRNRPLLPWRRD